MEREGELFSLSEKILTEWLFRGALSWFEHVGAKLKPEGRKTVQRIFREILYHPDKKRDMSRDSREIFVGFERDFRGLENIPETGPVLFLIWHYPEGPLSFWGLPFWISEAIKERREDTVVLVGAARFRLPFRSEGLAVGKKVGRQVIEGCYGGIYVDYGKVNVGAVKRIKGVLEDGQMVILAPDDVDREIIPPKEIGRLKPEAIKLVAWLTEKIPELSIIATLSGFSKENSTLILDFVPLSGVPETSEEWR